MATNQIEKLLTLLQVELVKTKESQDLERIEDTFREVEFFYKKYWSEFLDYRQKFFIDNLQGKEQGKVGLYDVTYKPQYRFVFNARKAQKDLEDLCKENNIDYKEIYFEHKATKPILKIKN
jgi:hypothetical protein